MRTYCIVVMVLNAVLGLAATVVVLLWASGGLPPSIVHSIDAPGLWDRIRLMGFLVPLIVLSGNLLGLLLALILAADRTIQMPIDEGKVSIAVAAVEQSLARTACALPDVRGVNVRVLKRRGSPPGIRIQADYTAWEGTAVKEVTQRLQEVLRMRAQEIMGADVPLEFDIRLAGIALKETKKPGEKRKKDRKENLPYGGPVYPIDEPL